MMTTAPTLAFSVAEYEERLRTVRRSMAEAGLDALLVTAPENICYLTGFATTGYHVFQCLVLPLETDPFFVLRNIEMGNAEKHSWISDATPFTNLDAPEVTLIDVLRHRVGTTARIGYDELTTWLSPLVVDSLRATFGEERIRRGGGLVERARAVKSAAELGYIEQAAAMADAAFVAGADAVLNAPTDSDVAAAVQAELARQGSGYTGSPAYVVGGAASATTHATHQRRPVEDGDPVWLEIPASVERYHACVSRVVTKGEARSPELIRAFEAASGAVAAMVDAARDGITAGELDAVGRHVTADHGFADSWVNRSAYAVGLSFPPGLGEGHIIDLKPNDRRIVRENMVFHMIPILKVTGVAAVGCTETVVVGREHGRSLTSLPRSSDASAFQVRV